MANKQFRILCWADSFLASTGFGTVTRNVLQELQKTGLYEINVLGVNYYGDAYDQVKYPYQMSPARLLDPNDPFGNKMFVRAVERGDYDIIWILNDIFVVEGIVPMFNKLLEQKKDQGRKIPKIIYYYPVDCTVLPDVTAMIDLADSAVCITEHGKRETLKALSVKKDIEVIYHGCDSTIFHSIDKKTRHQWRNQHLGITSPNTFLFINVNRNSVRKDIARTIYAFAEFHKLYPDSKLYLHTAAKDTTINLLAAVKAVNLTFNDVIFPANFNLAEGGMSEQNLVNFYGSADAFITTTLGEGWGLTAVEAMAMGIPVIAPNNTSHPEIFGEDKDRGYLYECKDVAWVDNSGFRPVGRIEDIVEKMVEVYKGRGSMSQQAIISRARSFVNDHSWEDISKSWVTLFDKVLKQPSKILNTPLTTEV